MKRKHYHLTIGDMQCIDCENSIEEAVLPLPGVILAKASFTDESLDLVLDADVLPLQSVCDAIKNAGYSCRRQRPKNTRITAGGHWFTAAAAAAIVVFLLVEVNRLLPTDLSLPEIGENASYGVLFLVGLLTSFHCVGMCGGFVLSYAMGGRQGKSSAHLQHFSYGLGKLISYSSIGALFGAIGGAISFSPAMRSLVLAFSGLFLLVYGLSMLDSFPSLRRYQLRLPRFAAHALTTQRRHLSSPFSIGLLNGLMIACGPLQAMYIAAAAGGDPLRGALMLAFFGLGTLPALFTLGYLSHAITTESTRRFLKVSSLIIVLMGTVMVNRALALSGSGYDMNSLWTKATAAVNDKVLLWKLSSSGDADAARIQEGYQVIYMEVDPHAYVPADFTLRKDVPVKWIINVKELSTCNREIIVPAMSLDIKLKRGLQIVEFTPEQTGVVGWSCYMGMIPGSFIVRE